MDISGVKQILKITQPNFLQTLVGELYTLNKKTDLDKRYTAIEELQKYCLQPLGHLQFGKDTFPSFVQILSRNNDNTSCLELKLNEVTEQEILEIQETSCAASFSSELETFKSRVIKLARNHETNRKMVKLKDEMELDKMFICDVTPQKSKLEELSNIFQNIQLATVSQNVNTEPNPRGIVHTTEYRDLQLKAAYYLSSLSSVDDKTHPLYKIIRNLMSYEKLTEEEVQFIEHIWNKDIIPTNMLSEITEKFNFLYEKPALIICTNLLRNNIEELNNFKLLIKMVFDKSDNKYLMKSKLKNMLYEIFSLSYYNTIFLDLIKIVEYQD